MKENRAAKKVFYDVLDTLVGAVYLVFSSDVLTGISFQKPSGSIIKKTGQDSCAKKELIEYFANKRRDFACDTIFLEGTDFEKIVWASLKSIPYGETRTYKWLAIQIGTPNAFRAVGNALKKNPIPIIFPCHRIIESDGSIGGFSSGVDIKRRLLELEYYTKQ